MNKKQMTIKQAQQLLGCENQNQLAKRIGVRYQAVQYWRKSLEGKLPYPWDEIVRMKAKET